jgi:hypothetical protein
MRLLLASLTAVTAVAFAAPSFAQEATATAPTETPTPAPKTTKHKATTTANSCSALKSDSAKAACAKRQQHAAATPAPTKPHKPAKKVAAKQTNSLTPPSSAEPAPSSSPVSVPPLPQKTI